jgi:CheY-like chemotaxis protein
MVFLQTMTEARLKKILVVDDEEETLTHISNILKRSNYEVVSTTKGKEALKLAANLL